MVAVPQDLFNAAKTVLSYSYSPYSKYQVACAIRAADGRIFSGCNIENASYGAVICAEGAAVCCMVSQGQHAISEILVLVDDVRLAAPCGICRQRFSEMTRSDTIIHCCTVSGLYRSYEMAELLPEAFVLL